MKARIAITLKQGVLDPQGKAVHSALVNLGFDMVQNVRQGKIIDLELQELTIEDAQDKIKRMCTQLLTNMVIEDFEILSIS